MKLLPVGLAMFVLAAATPAFAAPESNGPRTGYHARRQADVYAGQPAALTCARWCVQDLSPCDPPEFKISDGRCRPPGGGDVK